MRFAEITLQNWRNFQDAQVELQTRAFLVGPNASGKSNFLDAIRFLRDVASSGGGLQASVELRGGVSRIRSLAARQQSDVAIEARIQDGDDSSWRYRLAFAQDSQRNAVVKEEKVWRGGTLVLDRPNDDDRGDPARLRQTHLEQTIANAAFREIATFFADIRYYHIVPHLVRDPERSTRKGDPYGADLLEQLANTDKRTLTSRLRRIRDALRVAVPQLDELKLDKDARGVPHLYGNYRHWRPRGAWQTEMDFSDGTLRLLGLLWALLDGTGPLLLEEPELSLHRGIVRQIPQLMRSVQRGRKRPTRQVILSTHSGDLLADEGIGADEILLVVPTGEGSMIRVGADISEILQALRAGLSPAEAVMPHVEPHEAWQLSLWGKGIPDADDGNTGSGGRHG